MGYWVSPPPNRSQNLVPFFNVSANNCKSKFGTFFRKKVFKSRQLSRHTPGWRHGQTGLLWVLCRGTLLKNPWQKMPYHENLWKEQTIRHYVSVVMSLSATWSSVNLLILCFAQNNRRLRSEISPNFSKSLWNYLSLFLFIGFTFSLLSQGF